MRPLLIILGLIGVTQIVFSASMPLTSREISLMLRSGYSNDAVVRELSSRHFGDTLDAAAEKQLTQAGANAALIEALRNGSFQASPAEIAAAREKMAAEEERAAQATERSNEKTEGYAMEGNARANSAPPGKTANSAPPGKTANIVYKFLKGDLVWRHQGSTVHFDDEGLEQKNYYLFFFSANWSRPGRQFTAQLINYYNRVAPQHPEFEVIFFSADRSQFGMETYLGQTNMPWPAIAYPQTAAKSAAMQTDLVHDVPALILVNAAGQVLSATGNPKAPKTPDQVLEDVDRVLARK